ncbi:MAG: NAD(P)/FAD-dependent oxidoreductase [Terriglobia bacterium]
MATPVVIVDHSALKTDVLIVGAGPAGLAAAIAARQKGFKVTVADCAFPPIDKACGEGLMPGGVRALGQLGIVVGSTDSFPFRGIRFIGCGVSSEAAFPEGHGSGVRRTTLHRALLARAREVGVSVLWGTRVQTDLGKRVSVNGQPAQYDWLIGADGQGSKVRRWAGLEAGRGSSRRFGFRRHFQAKPWADCVEVYWGERSQLFITPVGAKEVCVAVLSRHPHPRLAGALPSFPEVASRLKNAPPTSMERGAICANHTFRAVARNRVALVGDASGSVDAITGDGISLAFQQAIALAAAMERGDLTLYQAAHRSILRTPALMARLMVKLDRYAWLRRRALRGLASEPGLFAGLFAVHVGASPATFGVRRAAALAWRLLGV